MGERDETWRGWKTRGKGGRSSEEEGGKEGDSMCYVILPTWSVLLGKDCLVCRSRSRRANECERRCEQSEW